MVEGIDRPAGLCVGGVERFRTRAWKSRRSLMQLRIGEMANIRRWEERLKNERGFRGIERVNQAIVSISRSKIRQRKPRRY